MMDILVGTLGHTQAIVECVGNGTRSLQVRERTGLVAVEVPLYTIQAVLLRQASRKPRLTPDTLHGRRWLGVYEAAGNVHADFTFESGPPVPVLFQEDVSTEVRVPLTPPIVGVALPAVTLGWARQAV